MNSTPTSSPSNRIGPRCPSTNSTPPPRPLSDNSDRNNNATPPQVGANRGGSIPTQSTPLAPSARRASTRSPPVGARPKDLPPGAAPLGSIPRPNVPLPPSSNHSPGISVPLLASQLGRPVNLGDRGSHVPGAAAAAAAAAANLMGSVPPLTPHHLNILSHTLSPFAAIPRGDGKIVARNINGTCKSNFTLVYNALSRPTV